MFRPQKHTVAGFALLMLAAFLGGMLATPALQALIARHNLRLNTTPSLPVGLYQRTSSSKLISFCVDEPYARLALERGYRSRGAVEPCGDGGEPLLKQIVAEEGDLVTLSAEGLAVNGALLPNSRPLRLDSAGRTLRGFPFGSYITRHGEVWVVNSYNRLSFDSRYYGPVRIAEIREYLKTLLVIP